MANLEQKNIDRIEALEETLHCYTERQLQTESNWIAARAGCPEYLEYMKAKRGLENVREEFSAIWFAMSINARETLAAQFWPDVEPNERFDHNGLPVRVYRKDIKDFNEQYPPKVTR